MFDSIFLNFLDNIFRKLLLSVSSIRFSNNIAMNIDDSILFSFHLLLSGLFLFFLIPNLYLIIFLWHVDIILIDDHM